MKLFKTRSKQVLNSRQWCQLGCWFFIFCMDYPGTVLAAVSDTTDIDTVNSSSRYWEIGVRSVDVDGNKEKYRQHINLDNGAWLSGFGWRYLPEEKSRFTPDQIEVKASNLGGEPFENFTFGVRKFGNYRLSYQRQKSVYFYQDILIDPADEDAESSNAGDFHHFDFDRIRERLEFDVELTNRAKLFIDLDQYSKDGDSTTVFDIQREEFELEQPIDEKSKNFNLGFEYRWDKTSVTINQRWRDFDNDVDVFLLDASEGSSPMDPTRLERFFLQQPYAYDSRESQLGLTFQPAENWVLQADMLYADLDMDLNSIESATGVDFLGQILDYNLNGEGLSRKTIRQYYLSSSFAFTDKVRLNTSIREQDLEQTSDLDVVDQSGVMVGEDDSANQWHIDSNTWSIGLETIISNSWTLSGGFTAEERTTRYVQAVDENAAPEDELSQSDGYYLILGYRSPNGMTMNLSAEDNIIDDPFTLSAPTDSRRYRLRVGYKFNKGLKLNSSYAWRKYNNDFSGWEANSKQTNLRLSYVKDQFSTAFGITFVDIDRSIDQLVTGGFVQVLFPINYQANADFWDGLVRWQMTHKSQISASYRNYDNEGSFAVKRDDARIALNVELPHKYSLGASYRNIDYVEDFESFDAEILELTLTRRW